MRNENKKIILPIIFVFILLNALFTIFKSFIEKYGFNREFLIVANLFFFGLSLVAFFLQRRGLRSANPNVFIRAVYTSILVKLFACIIVVTTYAFIKAKSIDRSSVFFSMGLYVIYTSIEVAALMKVAKGKINA